MASSPPSPDLSDLDWDMPSFRLLSESDEEVRPPKRKREVCFPSYNPDTSDSSDTDPSWNYRKKYIGGDHLPDGVEWNLDLEEGESGDSEVDSFTTEEIGGMTSDTEIFFAKPVGSPMKLMRFEQSKVLQFAVVYEFCIASISVNPSCFDFGEKLRRV
ncbi:hypothetical protein DM860_001421 [Cuscuta australis]|uniref:Uncharacterized protein n=1 Tax=Cuscuta australis TaxID=267555 RepID=A0A328ECI0_9ASTE|nr:hypothetical protein DM860_001421 [Cuscuta australis]